MLWYSWWISILRIIRNHVICTILCCMDSTYAFAHLQLPLHILKFLLFAWIERWGLRNDMWWQTATCFSYCLSYFDFVLLLYWRFDHLLLIIDIRGYICYTIIIVLCLLLLLKDSVAWNDALLVLRRRLVVSLPLTQSLLLLLVLVIAKIIQDLLLLERQWNLLLICMLGILFLYLNVV